MFLLYRFIEMDRKQQNRKIDFADFIIIKKKSFNRP